MGFERTVEWKGQTHTVTEWAAMTGIPFKILIARLNCGWPLDKTFTKHVRGWHKGPKAELLPELNNGCLHRMVILDTEYGDQGGIL